MKPKKLSLSEMWLLYQQLRPAIDGRESKDLLIDEVLDLLELSPEGTLVACLGMLYDNISMEKLNPLDAGLYFIRGLKKNGFFEFVEYVRMLNGSPKSK